MSYFSITMKILFITIAFSALLATSSCKNRDDSDNRAVQPVKTCAAMAATDGSRLVFPGKVVSDDKVYTAFKVAGRIASLSVKEGDNVRSGQVIGRLDDTDYRVALDAAEAEYNSVRSEAERIIALYNENATTSVAHDKAVYGLQQITAKLQHARNQLNDTRLTAPASGEVKAILRHAGEVVGAGTPVLEIVDNSTPLVEIKIPAAAFSRINDFTDYTCTFDIYPGRTFRLKPFAEQSVANANQLYTVKLSFDDAGEPLPSVGMSTTVIMQAGNGSEKDDSNRWIVPSTSLAGAGSDSYIFTVSPDSTLRKVPVEVVRLTRDGEAEISCAAPLDGIDIVAAGAGRLRENEKIKPLAPASPTNVGNQL